MEPVRYDDDADEELIDEIAEPGQFCGLDRAGLVRLARERAGSLA
jgi:hypothetical protein